MRAPRRDFRRKWEDTFGEIWGASQRLEAKSAGGQDQLSNCCSNNRRLSGEFLPQSRKRPKVRHSAATEQLHMVLTSRSWRLTRPLRALRGLFNRWN